MHLRNLLIIFTIFFMNGLSSQNFNYKEYTVNDGLLSSDNYMTYQTSDGFMWICSEKGLIKFDGVNYKSFTIKEGLPTNDIWYVKEDSQNRLWLGGFFEGLYYIKNNEVIRVNSKLISSNLLFSAEKGDTIFFQKYRSSNSYYLYNNVFKETGEQLRLNVKNIKINISTNFENELLFKNKKLKLETKWFSFIQNFDKQFIALNNDSIFIFNSNNYIIDNEKTIFGEKPINILTVTPTKSVMVQTENDIKVYKDVILKERDFLLEQKLLPFLKEKISWITKDDEGNIWLTLFRNNIVFIPINNTFIKQFKISEKREENSIINLENLDNKVIVNTHNGSVFSVNPKTFDTKILNKSDKRYTTKVYNLSYNNETIQYSTAKFLVNFKNNKKELLHFNQDHKTKLHGKMLFLKKNIFISQYFEMYNLKKDSFILIDQTYKIEDRVRDFIETENYFISGGKKGVHLLDKKTKKKSFYPLKDIQTIISFDEKILAGTNGNGLVLMDIEGKVLTKKLSGLSINDIEYSDNFFIATNKGIFIETLSKNEFVTQNIINNSDGLSSNEVRSIAIDSSVIYAGAVNGLNIINYNELINSKLKPPRIILNYLLVNEKTQDLLNTKFSYNENNLSFNITGISFYSLGNIKYKYRLKGQSKQWNYTTKNNIEYLSLPSGDYVFEATAFNSKKLESENRIEYSFTIKKHLTETFWFKSVLLMIAISSILFFLSKLQDRKIKKLKTEKKFADLELKALQSQMNPHFIFNSLNAIQSVMFLKGEKETNKYIGAFSKLMRLTLDNSKKSTISLTEEIAYLETYLDLEKRRLNGKLNYDIEYSDEIDIDEIKIPIMIFQPLVENAILHGLIPLKNNRELKVKFSLENDLLKGEVIDNGIGITAAQKKLKGKEYKSWASTILKEKIEVLNKLYKKQVEYKIVDLETENKQGTKVIILLPL